MATSDTGGESADHPGGIVKVQRSSDGRYSVTLPKEWAEDVDLDPGERLYVGASPDGDREGVVKPVERLLR